MPEPVYQNRLTIVGPRADIKACSELSWEAAVQAKHVELLETFPKRAAWQFETETESPINWLAEISRCWPKLTFLLDYEQEEGRIKGLAKAKAGALEHYVITY